MEQPTQEPPIFLSLGMLVLDELHFPDGTVQDDILGGSGIYSTLGARLAVDEHERGRIASFVLAGEDFPFEKVEGVLRDWGVESRITRVHGEISTRGKLVYHDTNYEKKSYSYLTQPLQPLPHHLPTHLLASSSFHLLSSPSVLPTQLFDLKRCRAEHGIEEPPLLVWEPAPLSCKADFLDEFVEAAGLMDIFSPNHVEFFSICNEPCPHPFDRSQVENCALRFLIRGTHSKPLMSIIRCSSYGALIIERKGPTRVDFAMSWVPAFFSPEEQARVVDATGAGNTFLGAFAVGYQRNGRDAVKAAESASVAASFAVEQVGLPMCEDGLWNGEGTEGRMGEYLRKRERTVGDST